MKCTSLKRFFAAIMAGLLGLPLVGAAQASPQTIYWAGVAFVGNASDIAERNPYLAEWVDETGLLELNQRAWSELQKVERDDLEFSTDLGRSESGNAIAMALALDFEQINGYNITQLNSFCVPNAQIYAQILTFDMTESKLLSSFPIKSKRIRDCEENTQSLSKQKALAWVDELMVGEGDSLMSVFPRAVSRLPLNRGWMFNIKVREVALGDFTKRALEENNIPEDAYKRWLAAQVTSNMSEKLEIPVLPHSLGQAIGGAMPLRFSEASASRITLPPADYVVDLVARGYIKRTGEETAARANNTYIFGLGFSVRDPMLDTVFFDQNLQFFESRTENKADGIPTWEGYERVTLTSIPGIFDQFLKPDKKWAEKWVKNLKDKKTSWKNLKKGFQRAEKEVFSEIRGD